MNRFHVHVAVTDLGRSIAFYSTLFGAKPTVETADYAKWMLDDPRVNFAISTRPDSPAGIDHLGIQVENDDELNAIDARLKEAEHAVVNQTDAACCYARSDKAWSADPAGVLWETFRTHGEHTVYGGDRRAVPPPSACRSDSARADGVKTRSACAG